MHIVNMEDSNLKLKVNFFHTDSGSEPVRNWLKSLSGDEKKAIGTEIKVVQFGWPLGMPVVRPLEKKMWEVRVALKNTIARIIFTLDGNLMILLHGFIKKDQNTREADKKIARKRMKQYFGGKK